MTLLKRDRMLLRDTAYRQIMSCIRMLAVKGRQLNSKGFYKLFLHACLSQKYSSYFCIGIGIILLQVKSMSNMAQYSPFNRSYQFIHLQNSAYHLKNKLNVKPLVKTNLKRSAHSSFSKNKNKTPQPSHRYSFSDIRSTQNLKQQTSRDCLGEYYQPRRVIHRDQITERAKSARINRQNMEIVKRLIQAECMVTDKTRAETFYQKHQTYRNLRRRYQDNGERHVIGLGNLQLLNPTLASFRTSHNQSKGAIGNVEEDDTV